MFCGLRYVLNLLVLDVAFVLWGCRAWMRLVVCSILLVTYLCETVGCFWCVLLTRIG